MPLLSENRLALKKAFGPIPEEPKSQLSPRVEHILLFTMNLQMPRQGIYTPIQHTTRKQAALAFITFTATVDRCDHCVIVYREW